MGRMYGFLVIFAALAFLSGGYIGLRDDKISLFAGFSHVFDFEQGNLLAEIPLDRTREPLSISLPDVSEPSSPRVDIQKKNPSVVATVYQPAAFIVSSTIVESSPVATGSFATNTVPSSSVHASMGNDANGIFETSKTVGSSDDITIQDSYGSREDISSGSNNSPSGELPPLPPLPLPIPSGRAVLSEIMVGVEFNADYEFIELYNPTVVALSLTGWSIKKKTSSGNESSFVSASRLEGKTILPQNYFLLAHEGKYNGAVIPDVWWPASYSLAYSHNSLVMYNANGEKVEEVSWIDIQKGSSFSRVSWDSTRFEITSTPTPRASR